MDAELLPPRAWIERYGIEAGQWLLPLNIEALPIQGLARIDSVTAAPRIANGMVRKLPPEFPREERFATIMFPDLPGEDQKGSHLGIVIKRDQP